MPRRVPSGVTSVVTHSVALWTLYVALWTLHVALWTLHAMRLHARQARRART